MNEEASAQVLTILHLLAKGARYDNLSAEQLKVLNENVEALMKQDTDPFVRDVLVRLKDARALNTGLLEKLQSAYR
jgi:hypothetical protein